MALTTDQKKLLRGRLVDLYTDAQQGKSSWSGELYRLVLASEADLIADLDVYKSRLIQQFSTARDESIESSAKAQADIDRLDAM